MKRNGLFFMILMVICMAITGCKSRTLDEEIDNRFNKDDKEVLYRETIEQRPFVLYKAPLDNGKTGVGLAVFEGNEKEGWKLTTANSMYYETNILIDSIGVNFDNGVRKHFIYGFVDDPAIKRIEITDKYNKIIEAAIIETNWKRVWYGLVEMNEMKLKVFDKNNEIISEVPYKNKNLQGAIDFTTWDEEKLYAFLNEILMYTKEIPLRTNSKEEITRKYERYFTPELSGKIFDSSYKKSDNGWFVPDGDAGYIFTVPGEYDHTDIKIEFKKDYIKVRESYEIGMYSLIEYTIQDDGKPIITDWIQQ